MQRWILGFVLAAPLAAAQRRVESAEALCVPLTDEFVVTSDVKFCPGRYAFDDPELDGVIRVAASGVTIDMEGVTLTGSAMAGFAIVVDGVDDVTIRGAAIHGYQVAVYLSNGSGHHVEDCDLSGQRKRPTFHTGADFLGVWPDLAGQFAADQIGNALLLSNVTHSRLANNVCTLSQNGIGLFESSHVEIVGNDCDSNEGWGLHLHRSSHNAIVGNSADHNFDHESTYCHGVQQDGCDTAALLVIKDSNDNLVVGNSLRDSGDGVFSAAQEGTTHWGADRNVYRFNDCSLSKHIGLESTFTDANEFTGNVADGCGRYGFWLGFSKNVLVADNSIRGNAFAGISNESVLSIVYQGNDIGFNRVGVELRKGPSNLLDQDSRDHRFYGNWIHDSIDRGLSLVDTHEVRVLENTIENNVRGNLRFAVALEPELDGPLTVRRNDILLGGALYNVKNEQRNALDLTLNWWGTLDPLAIAATIQGRSQYSITPPHRLPVLEIVFQDVYGVATLRRVVNERADDALDVVPAGAEPRSNLAPDLRLGRAASGASFVTGLRFRDLYVPANATVLSARLLLPSVSLPQSAALSLRVFAEANDDSRPFESATMPNSRPRTVASAPWIASAPWAADEVVASPDLAPLIDEVLARPGWATGNALALIVADEGSTGTRAVHAFDFEGYATLPNTPAEFRHFRRHRFAKLEVEYDDGLGPLALERELASGADDADGCVGCNEVHFGFNGGSVTGGFRFPDVRIPLGATLLGARLRLPTDGTYTRSISVRLRGERLIAPLDYLTGSLPAFRPKTVGFVAWPITQTWTYLEWHPTPEIHSLVAEVRALPGWQPGNAMAFDVQNDGSTTARRVWGFDRDRRATPHDFPEIGATPFQPILEHPVGP